MRIGVTFFHEKRRTHHVTPITLTGRGTADLELQTGQNKTEYVQFNVSVNKGCQLIGFLSPRISMDFIYLCLNEEKSSILEQFTWEPEAKMQGMAALQQQGLLFRNVIHHSTSSCYFDSKLN